MSNFKEFADKIKEYTILVSQNGWEYVGHVTIKAKELKVTGTDSVIADGVEIYFDEEIEVKE